MEDFREKKHGELPLFSFEVHEALLYGIFQPLLV